MIKHYFKITFRNMWKYRTQSLIGIFGLAFGFACFVPALYWYRYETTYDSFYPDAAHIYRIYSVEKQTGKTNDFVSGILERKLREQFPAIETSTVFFTETEHCSAEGTPYIQLRTLFADSTFLHVFPQAVISGNARQPLEVLNNMILTESVAIRLFGDVENAIGQQIKSTLFTWFPPYTVTAVVKDPPPNTNIAFDAILSHEQLSLQKTFVENTKEQIWAFAILYGYVRLHPYTDINRFAAQLRDFPAQLDADTNIELCMLPVSDIRHRLNAEAPFTLNFIRLFVAAGVLLIFSAVFNFLNLYLDLFRQRFRELQQRKVHGAKSRQLIMQMMFELSCSILLSLLLACFFIILFRPMFSGLLHISVGVTQIINLFIICGTGVMALIQFIGIIPFWRLSRLSGYKLQATSNKKQAPMLRRMAITMQLAVSVVFIVAALVVMMQMRFVSHKDLGFDHNRIIHLSGLSFFVKEDVRTALIHELEAIPQIENITDAYFEPQHNARTMTTEVEWQGKLPSENPVFHTIPTDSRFAATFGLKMLMGKWWDESGVQKIVLNEEAVRVMGLSDPVGSVIRLPYNLTMEAYEVVGVVNDFHTLSLRNRIYPTIFRKTYPSNSLYIRVVSGQEREALRRINAILPEIDASLVDVYPTPLNELFDRLNHSEQAGLKMFSVLATVCLLISLFGIYAIAASSTQRRRKEIAIRKVFGAEVSDIVRMFFREHILQVIMAGFIALPLAYYAMHRWLQGYAYRTNIPWWLLAGVITAITTVVLLTVLRQVLKVANSNPAEVVKSE